MYRQYVARLGHIFAIWLYLFLCYNDVYVINIFHIFYYLINNRWIIEDPFVSHMFGSYNFRISMKLFKISLTFTFGTDASHQTDKCTEKNASIFGQSNENWNLKEDTADGRERVEAHRFTSRIIYRFRWTEVEGRKKGDTGSSSAI